MKGICLRRESILITGGIKPENIQYKVEKKQQYVIPISTTIPRLWGKTYLQFLRSHSEKVEKKKSQVFDKKFCK